MASEDLEAPGEKEPGAGGIGTSQQTVSAAALVDAEPGQPQPPELTPREGAATEPSLSEGKKPQLEKNKNEIKKMAEQFTARQAQNAEFAKRSELLKKSPAALEEVAEVCISIDLHVKKKQLIDRDSRVLKLDGSVMSQQDYLLMVGLPEDCVDSVAAAIDIMVDLPASVDGVKKLLAQPYFAEFVNWRLHHDTFSIRQHRWEFGQQYFKLSETKEQVEALREEIGGIRKNIAALVGKPESKIFDDINVDSPKLLESILGLSQEIEGLLLWEKVWLQVESNEVGVDFSQTLYKLMGEILEKLKGESALIEPAPYNTPGIFLPPIRRRVRNNSRGVAETKTLTSQNNTEKQAVALTGDGSGDEEDSPPLTPRTLTPEFDALLSPGAGPWPPAHHTHPTPEQGEGPVSPPHPSTPVSPHAMTPEPTPGDVDGGDASPVPVIDESLTSPIPFPEVTHSRDGEDGEEEDNLLRETDGLDLSGFCGVDGGLPWGEDESAGMGVMSPVQGRTRSRSWHFPSDDRGMYTLARPQASSSGSEGLSFGSAGPRDLWDVHQPLNGTEIQVLLDAPSWLLDRGVSPSSSASSFSSSLSNHKDSEPDALSSGKNKDPEPRISSWCCLFPQNRTIKPKHQLIGAAVIIAVAPWIGLAIETPAKAAAYRVAFQWNGFTGSPPGFANPWASAGVAINGVMLLVLVGVLSQSAGKRLAACFAKKEGENQAASQTNAIV